MCFIGSLHFVGGPGDCPECCRVLQPPNQQNCQQLDANHPHSLGSFVVLSVQASRHPEMKELVLEGELLLMVQPEIPKANQPPFGRC